MGDGTRDSAGWQGSGPNTGSGKLWKHVNSKSLERAKERYSGVSKLVEFVAKHA